MGGQRKMVDLSPFFLFEAAGDSSEADFHPNTQAQGDQVRCDSYDDDDAESSCSLGTERDGDGLSTLKVGHANDDNDDKGIVHSNSKGDWELSNGRCGGGDDGSYDHHRHMDLLRRSKSSYCSRFEQEEEEEEEEEEGEEEDLLRSEVASTANSYSSRSRTKSKCMLRSKSKRKKRTSAMNEKEKNKLFWENCLSSKSFSKICSRFLFP